MTDRIERTVLLAAPIERVWRALSDPAEFGAWFRVTITTPFVIGEEAHGRLTYSGYEHLAWTVRVVAMDAPTRFAFTWHPYAIDPDTDYSRETPTLVEFMLAREGDATRLTVIESGFDAVPAARRADALRMNEGGWTEQISNIAAHVDR